MLDTNSAIHLRELTSLAKARKDQVRTLEDHLARIRTALDGRPDVSSDKATRAEVTAGWAANDAEWVIANEGRDPPSRRGTDGEGRDG